MDNLTVVEFTAALSESEREKKEMERRKKIQIARLKCSDKPSYPVMTINMNGEGNAADQRKLLSVVMRSFSASVIFCQELPWKFEKEVVENCGTGNYSYLPSGKEAAVMWAEEDFDGEPVDVADKKKIRDRLVDAGKIDSEPASQILARTAVVKLKIKGKASNCTPAFLAVSWHGPFRSKLEFRKNVFKAFISFLNEVCHEKDVSSAIIGGDFNLNTLEELDVDKDLTEPRVSFPGYELSPRGELRFRDHEGPGRKYIPYKDNFAFFTIPRCNTKPPKGRLSRLFGDMIVSSVRPMLVFVNSEDPAGDLLKKDRKDVEQLITKEVLDHDPIIDVLHLETGKFSLQETRDLLALSILLVSEWAKQNKNIISIHSCNPSVPDRRNSVIDSNY